ncbi:MAG: hypothetical protein RL097_274 [Candidatus Parcubacteria bacterium]|jgi:hypothetical protein
MKDIKVIFLSTAVSAVLFYTMLAALETPQVYIDAVTRKCVAVEDRHGIRSCRHMPKKFDVVYVEPGLTFRQLVLLRVMQQK